MKEILKLTFKYILVYF